MGGQWWHALSMIQKTNSHSWIKLSIKSQAFFSIDQVKNHKREAEWSAFYIKMKATVGSNNFT